MQADAAALLGATQAGVATFLVIPTHARAIESGGPSAAETAALGSLEMASENAASTLKTFLGSLIKCGDASATICGGICGDIAALGPGPSYNNAAATAAATAATTVNLEISSIAPQFDAVADALKIAIAAASTTDAGLSLLTRDAQLVAYLAAAISTAASALTADGAAVGAAVT